MFSKIYGGLILHAHFKHIHTMKKTIFTIALAFTSIFASAQKGKFTIALGTTENVTPLAFGVNKDFFDKKSIPIHFEAGYHLTNKLQLALAVNHSSGETKEIDLFFYSYKADLKVTSVMLRTNFFWVNKEKFQLGSGLGLGYVLASEDITSISGLGNPEPTESVFRVHFNLLDARYFFTENIGVYGNFGFAYQGLYGIGVIGKF